MRLTPLADLMSASEHLLPQEQMSIIFTAPVVDVAVAMCRLLEQFFARKKSLAHTRPKRNKKYHNYYIDIPSPNNYFGDMKKMARTALGENIIRLRKKRGIKQVELIELAMTSSVAGIEAGSTPDPRISSVLAIARVLRVKVEDLVADVATKS
jgi:DNA-binding XRE family transcriptional regulator